MALRIAVQIPLVALMLSVPLRCFAADGGARPKALDLLHGVERARMKVKSGRLKIDIEGRYDGRRSVRRVQLQARFSGAKRWFEQFQRELVLNGTGREADENMKKLKEMRFDEEKFVKAGFGKFRNAEIRSIVKDSTLLKYSKGSGATINDISKGSSNYNFDPRVLGISVWHGVNDSVTRDLGYAGAKSTKVLGREKVNGHQTWKVQVVDKYNQQRTFWIENTEGFPVHRSEFRANHQRRRVTAHYSKKGKAWPLPERLVIESYQYGHPDKISQKSTFKITEVALGGHVDDALFGYAGLRMRVGTPVADIRIKRRIGYWDGTRIVERLP
jgi:hypothetical protein